MIANVLIPERNHSRSCRPIQYFYGSYEPGTSFKDTEMADVRGLVKVFR